MTRLADARPARATSCCWRRAAPASTPTRISRPAGDISGPWWRRCHDASSPRTRPTPTPPPPPRGAGPAGAAPTAPDYPLIVIMATLLGLGLVMVFSASFPQAPLLPEADRLDRVRAWSCAGSRPSFPSGVWRQLAIPIMFVTIVGPGRRVGHGHWTVRRPASAFRVQSATQ